MSAETTVACEDCGEQGERVACANMGGICASKWGAAELVCDACEERRDCAQSLSAQLTAKARTEAEAEHECLFCGLITEQGPDYAREHAENCVQLFK